MSHRTQPHQFLKVRSASSSVQHPHGDLLMVKARLMWGKIQYAQVIHRHTCSQPLPRVHPSCDVVLPSDLWEASRTGITWSSCCHIKTENSWQAGSLYLSLGTQRTIQYPYVQTAPPLNLGVLIHQRREYKNMLFALHKWILARSKSTIYLTMHPQKDNKWIYIALKKNRNISESF